MRDAPTSLREHIFPGGTLPSRQQFETQAVQAGLHVDDVFEFRPDYAETLNRWRKSFESNLPAIRRMGHDEAFIRKWRFYLSLCASAFRAGRTGVMQALPFACPEIPGAFKGKPCLSITEHRPPRPVGQYR